MKQSHAILFLLLSLIIVSCKPSRKQVNVLYFSTQTESGSLNDIRSVTEGWNIISSSDPVIFSEDSITDISAIVLRVSDLNQLDHRAIPRLKRYLEAGGGGIIALRDTALVDKGWPWLKNWMAQENGAMIDQDQGRLAVLDANYTAEELTAALDFVIGKNKMPDFDDLATLAVPDSSRYTREVLVEGLDEPLQMAILPNKNILFVERKGGIKLYEEANGETKSIANIDVFSGIEDGLLGVAADPNFEKNHWIYLYYAVGGDESINRLARYELHGDSLALGTETKVLEIPTQRIYCCHAAGYVAFDNDGLLYLAVGDNTNAEETEGFTPVDERSGRSLSDDQATAANTDDLRGKILRIRPLDDGGYAIPDGNLFPKDGSGGRPEIYMMGARNPFRFSVDSKNGYLYFGEVGPDTKVKASTGELMSFDEINQVREPGFFGWPYFLGNNEVFPMYDYETKIPGPGKDPAKPINDSPNNTGERELPPAQPAMIWYGKGDSKEFPLVGSGGASAMAGPVYYRSDFTDAPYSLSEYYDGKLFIYEWIRGWIMAVTFDEDDNYLRMEPFLDHLSFDAPVDFQFADDGSIYILEYGTNWFSKNTNARLLRIQYVEGNRAPKAEIEIDKQYGAAPMKVNLSASGSSDYDAEDQLSYEWRIDGKTLAGEELSYTFDKNGIYEVSLTVTDDQGDSGKATSKVFVGNTPPDVAIHTKANRSFYWDGVDLDYDIQVADKEEDIDPSRINISFGFIPHGRDAATILTGSQDVSSLQYIRGKQMIAALDCKSCHSLEQESVGPTYLAIAARYNGEPNAKKQLAEKIIKGGSGNWGERAMTPHPAISNEEAEEMVNYILSLTDEQSSLPLQDVIPLKEHESKGDEGAYLLNATYRDRGANGIDELQSRDYILLKSPLVQVEEFDEGNLRIGTITTQALSYALGIVDGKYMKFNAIDLSHVKNLTYRIQPNGAGGTIELRTGSMDGEILSSLQIPAASGDISKIGWKEFSAPLKDSQGHQDLYFVFKGGDQGFFNIDWIRFDR
ncbi:PQQ-dependent sugar dehydrogenase [Albibacterium indicum]|uniref:PQQ-dependent sugar dehydrogenase n=1 Tax=Albibacterium indicum TaxID=2292082 RepID=UPI00197EB7A7|nr:PQQ-dependent sugar dehydrogenase [Pedobacter indicus]